ncbi:MAG: hypothetical protein ACK5C5_02480 [Bacteroidota bacterium]|jgi:hypothetical protein
MSSQSLNNEEQEYNQDSQEGHIIDESGSEHSGRVRKRIKVRKKVRIRKKSDPKKKIRKMLERLFWVVLVVGFLFALITMFVELDIKDPKQKKLQQKQVPSGKTY